MKITVDRIYNRDSNIELARIVAMLMILALHAFNAYYWNSLSLQVTSQNIIALLGEAFTNCAVGLFVFISGWYGIKPKYRSFSNLVFQVLFYGFVIFLTATLLAVSVSWKGLKDMVLLSNSLWFIKSYFLLYLLSPVLNSFVEKADKRQFQLFLVSFFIFQSIWGWTNTAAEFNYGLSVVFFVFMYLLARYMKLYPHKITTSSKYVYLGIYSASALLIAIVVFLKHYYGLSPLTEHMLLSYVSPLMVLCSVCLFLFFSKLQFKSKIINWVSASCLSVYLIHANSLVLPLYQNLVWGEYLNRHYLLFLATIIGVFLFCILVDQLRRLIYSFIDRFLFKR